MKALLFYLFIVCSYNCRNHDIGHRLNRQTYSILKSYCSSTSCGHMSWLSLTVSVSRERRVHYHNHLNKSMNLKPSRTKSCQWLFAAALTNAVASITHHIFRKLEVFWQFCFFPSQKKSLQTERDVINDLVEVGDDLSVRVWLSVVFLTTISSGKVSLEKEPSSNMTS